MSHLKDSDVAGLPLHEAFSWRVAVYASLVAALVFAALDIGLGWAVRGISPWAPLRMMAAIALGPRALVPPDTFDARIVAVAVLLHVVLSIVYGTFLALVMPRVDAAMGILIGGLYGLALYYINFYGFTSFSPWFVDQRDWLGIVSHGAFGAVLACTYAAINKHQSSRETQALPPVRNVQLSGSAQLDASGCDASPMRLEQPPGNSTAPESDGCRAVAQGTARPMRREALSPDALCPRLSEAKELLPLVRGHLVATASRYPLPTGMGLDLLPIVEAGLFGYEFVPDRKAHTYLTIGCDAQGAPIVRKTFYGVGAPDALQLVALEGHILSRSERAARCRVQQRDVHFDDWAAAAEAAWAQLAGLFPERPRQPIALRENAHRCLDQALAMAHSHLEHWDPIIHFCGLPNESQHGFLLTGASGERGELLFQRPDIWMLRWKAPPQAVYESWSVVADGADAADGLFQGK